MEVLYQHCAGLDVHKDTVVACVRHMTNGTVKREVRTFKTMTTDLLASSEWLALEGCTHVVMEKRGAKKAIGAVAASMLTAAYHMLKDGTFYQDLGADHFDRKARGAHAKRLLAKLQSLGYDVAITPAAA